MMSGGVLLVDLRRFPDTVGMMLVAFVLFVLLAIWGEAVASGIWAEGSRGRAVVSGLAALFSVVGSLLTGALLSWDMESAMVVWGFAFAVLGLVSVVVGLAWVVGSLIRRRGGARAGRFTWASFTVAAFGLLGMVALAPHPPPVPDSIPDAAALDRYLEELVDSGSPPSVSVVVVSDGETVYRKAFGVRDGPNDLPATPDSVYHWYSTTKIATAIATLQLVEQGRLDLDDPVEEYLPFFDPRYPSGSSARVSIADLLNHSSGLPNNVPAVVSWIRQENDPALDQTEFLRARLPDYDDLSFEPGTEGVYTNVGYYVLAAVIEQVTGQEYEDYIVDSVLDPLGMDNTRFEYEDRMVDHEAVGAHPMADPLTMLLPFMDPPWPVGYSRDHDDGWIWFERFLFEGNAPSGLIGPVSDKGRLVTMVLNGGELDGEQVLSERSVETLLTGYHIVAGDSPEMGAHDRYDAAVHGLGWFVVQDGARTFHDHRGGGPGFATYMRLYADEGLGIAILANGTNLDTLDLADAIADIPW